MALSRTLAALAALSLLAAPVLLAHSGDHSALSLPQTLAHAAFDGWQALVYWAVAGVAVWQTVRLVRRSRVRSRSDRRR